MIHFQVNSPNADKVVKCAKFNILQSQWRVFYARLNLQSLWKNFCLKNSVEILLNGSEGVMIIIVIWFSAAGEVVWIIYFIFLRKTSSVSVKFLPSRSRNVQLFLNAALNNSGKWKAHLSLLCGMIVLQRFPHLSIDGWFFFCLFPFSDGDCFSICLLQRIHSHCPEGRGRRGQWRGLCWEFPGNKVLRIWMLIQSLRPGHQAKKVASYWAEKSPQIQGTA